MAEPLLAGGFTEWEREITAAGGCSRPVRLRGRTTAVDLATGEKAVTYDTASEPFGVLHVACGNRRESACPSCSAVYKRDARQLVRAGLAGGKGVPASVAEHPCVFATVTAPSFGPVHSRRERNGQAQPCRPRRAAARRACPHGRDISCNARHCPQDPRLGRPMCPDCYDYEGAVVFNAGAPKLWQRFLTYLPRPRGTSVSAGTLISSGTAGRRSPSHAGTRCPSAISGPSGLPTGAGNATRTGRWTRGAARWMSALSWS